MQQILKIEIDGKPVVSKPFDFEAMCLINDTGANKPVGHLTATKEAISYMFEGTKATDEEIEKLPVSERVALCGQVWNFYIETLKAAGKNG